MRAWVYVLLVLLTPEEARSRRADRVLVFKSVEARVVSVGDTFAVQYRIFNVGQSCAPTILHSPPLGPRTSSGDGVRARRPIFDISLSDGNWHRNFSRVVGAGLSSLPSPTVRCNLAACLPLDRRAACYSRGERSDSISMCRAHRTHRARLRRAGSRLQRTPPAYIIRCSVGCVRAFDGVLQSMPASFAEAPICRTSASFERRTRAHSLRTRPC